LPQRPHHRLLFKTSRRCRSTLASTTVQWSAAWTFVYDGFGCTGFVSLTGNIVLIELPQASAQPTETHAGLALGPATVGDVTVQVDMATRRQLRTGSAPNAWEVGWLLALHRLAGFLVLHSQATAGNWARRTRRPPAGSGSLVTADSPQFPFGSWYRVRVVQTGSTIQVYVNNLLITTFTDVESPYTSGRVGLYTEDAESYFDNVSVKRPGDEAKKK
jgi:3-keto-disaccharide hydrolase